MQKRGQVTVFILVGLFILIIIGLAIVAWKFIFPNVPTEFADIDTYVSNCVANAADEGLFLLGIQGGYISAPDKVRLNPHAHLDLGYIIPLWFFKGEDRSPTIYGMQEQLEVYLNAEVEACLRNMTSFRQEFDIEIGEDVISDVLFAKEHVEIAVDIPLAATMKGTNTTFVFPEFSTRVESNVRRMYDLALAIHDYENENAIFEQLTNEMIAASDEIPYGGMIISCDKKRWLTEEIRTYVQELIKYNIAQIKYENTDYIPSTSAYYQSHYTIDVTDEDYTDFRVNTVYSNTWDLQLEVLPSSNGVVKPIEVPANKWFPLCLNIYNHKYTTYYPVMIQIIDNNNPDHVFSFATPVIMNKNNPDRYEEATPWPSEVSELASERYCKYNETETRIYTGSNGYLYNMTEVVDKRVHDLSVTAVDSYIGFPEGSLFNVSVDYQCVLSRCEIGMTDYPRTADGLLSGNIPELRENYPQCESGWIILSKDGYLEKYVQQTVSDETDGSSLVVDMHRLKELPITITVVQDNFGTVFEREMTNDERAVVSLSYKPEDYEEFYILPTDEPSFRNAKLLVSDVTYEVEVWLMEDENMIGVTSLNWTVTGDEVLNAQEVEFQVFYNRPQTPPETSEDFRELWETSIKESVNYPPILT